jgi:hypothetical protein
MMRLPFQVSVSGTAVTLKPVCSYIGRTGRVRSKNDGAGRAQSVDEGGTLMLLVLMTARGGVAHCSHYINFLLGTLLWGDGAAPPRACCVRRVGPAIVEYFSCLLRSALTGLPPPAEGDKLWPRVVVHHRRRCRRVVIVLLLLLNSSAAGRYREKIAVCLMSSSVEGTPTRAQVLFARLHCCCCGTCCDGRRHSRAPPSTAW